MTMGSFFLQFLKVLQYLAQNVFYQIILYRIIYREQMGSKIFFLSESGNIGKKWRCCEAVILKFKPCYAVYLQLFLITIQFTLFSVLSLSSLTTNKNLCNYLSNANHFKFRFCFSLRSPTHTALKDPPYLQVYPSVLFWLNVISQRISVYRDKMSYLIPIIKTKNARRGQSRNKWWTDTEPCEIQRNQRRD